MAEYKANIKIALPEDVDASVTEIEPAFEKVKLHENDDLKCTPDGIEAMVSYKVKRIGGGNSGETVVVDVTEVGAGLLGNASGSLGETISVMVEIPGHCSHNDGNNDDDDDDEDEDEDEDEQDD